MKKKFTDVEKFYIAEKSKAGVTHADIAADLDTTLKSIQPYIVEAPKEEVKQPRQETLTSKAFARHRRGGVVVSTPAASELGENKPAKLPPHLAKPDCIAQTKNDN